MWHRSRSVPFILAMTLHDRSEVAESHHPNQPHSHSVANTCIYHTPCQCTCIPASAMAGHGHIMCISMHMAALVAGTAPPPQPTPTPMLPSSVLGANISWWQNVTDHALLTSNGGEGCAASARCTASAPYPVGQPPAASAAHCMAECELQASCAGWNLLKDTSRSGRHGKGALCFLYGKGGLAAAPPFYTADANFDCGSKAQPKPAPPPAPSGGRVLWRAADLGSGFAVQAVQSHGQQGLRFELALLGVPWLASDDVRVRCNGQLLAASNGTLVAAPGVRVSPIPCHRRRCRAPSRVPVGASPDTCMCLCLYCRSLAAACPWPLLNLLCSCLAIARTTAAAARVLHGQVSNGTDRSLGAWSGITQQWHARAGDGGCGGAVVTTGAFYFPASGFFEFRLAVDGAVPGSADSSARPSDSMSRNLTQTSTMFPVFTLLPAALDLGRLSWSGDFLAGTWEKFTAQHSFPNRSTPLAAPAYCGGSGGCAPYQGGMTSGPLVLFSSSAPSSGKGPNRTGASRLPPAVTVSPISNFKASFVASTHAHMFHAGASPFLQSLVPGFQTRVAVFPRTGIQNSLQAWGAAVQRLANTSRLPLSSDRLSRQLAYFMDEGAATCACELFRHAVLPPISETIRALKRYHDGAKIPVGIYAKGGPPWYSQCAPHPNGPAHCPAKGTCVGRQSSPWASSFVPSRYHFPHGMDPERNTPALLFFSWMGPLSDNSYANKNWTVQGVDGWVNALHAAAAKEGINYNKTHISPEQALPFWISVLAPLVNQSNLGACTWDGVDELSYSWIAHLREPALTETLMHGFADAALAMGLPIRVDMHSPSDAAFSTELDAWTVSRCGPDAIPSSQEVVPQMHPSGAQRGNWQFIAANGALLSSCGLRPMKDVLWSRPQQHPNPYPQARRLNIEHDLIVAVLSTGPVGIGDAVNQSNRSFLMPAITRNGTILKPAAAAARMDRFYSGGAGRQNEEIWTAISGPARSANQVNSMGAFFDQGTWWWFSILGTNLSPHVAPVAVEELWPQSREGQQYLVDRGRQSRCTNNSAAAACLRLWDASTPLAVGTGGGLPGPSDPLRRFELLSAAPVLPGGWALIGEESKYVRVSPQRFVAPRSDMSASEKDGVSSDAARFANLGRGGALCFGLLGAPQELVTVTVVVPSERSGTPLAGMIRILDITLDSKGMASVKLGRGQD